MSYQHPYRPQEHRTEYRSNEVHRLNEFVPTYVPHSDYLPSNRIVDSNVPEAERWVTITPLSSPATKTKKEAVTSTPRGPVNSTPTDTYPSAPTKM